jgi:bromodomain-containing protein 8
MAKATVTHFEVNTTPIDGQGRGFKMASSLKGVSVSQTEELQKWTLREKLILASAVQRSGDQNWASVSRSIKPLVDETRPADFYSQKNCAIQYAAMLDKAATPKRKRKEDGAPDVGGWVYPLVLL